MTEPSKSGPEKKSDLVLWIAGAVLVALALIPILHAMRSRREETLPLPPRHLAPAASSSAAPIDR